MSIINFNLRIPEEINDKIIEIASEEGRSKNKQIEYILKEYIKNYTETKNNIAIKQNNKQGDNIVKIKGANK